MKLLMNFSTEFQQMLSQNALILACNLWWQKKSDIFLIKFFDSYISSSKGSLHTHKYDGFSIVCMQHKTCIHSLFQHSFATLNGFIFCWMHLMLISITAVYRSTSFVWHNTANVIASFEMDNYYYFILDQIIQTYLDLYENQTNNLKHWSTLVTMTPMKHSPWIYCVFLNTAALLSMVLQTW